MNKDEPTPDVEKFEFNPTAGEAALAEVINAPKRTVQPTSARNEDSGRRRELGGSKYVISKSGAWVRITPKIEHTVTGNKAKLRRMKKGKF